MAGKYGLHDDMTARGRRGGVNFDNPDFNFRSLRGTSVLRWEYAVRSFFGGRAAGRIRSVRDLTFERTVGAIRDRPTNVFQINGDV